ncbi:trypsin-like peptidase domain-containing protein [Fulvivirga sp. 29W222]|uniref:Trypsin-like peptidase domain-containing protein n=1 Tax=Fulvivirga marina TaxID=2494733 RepID=A0A937G3Z4_9BACT|nr:serine protease [Fulvivirga marina]MBL6449588.1 trypsin-like peptidase domain-containing protein [Fulvivirga marina]
MAIFNQFYPVDYYDKAMPVDLKEKAEATCIVCAVGQKFLNSKNGSLTTKTSGYYYNTNDPKYPGGGQGTLCPDIAAETAVWMTGTAFAIGKKTFITAKHVVEDVLNEVDAKPTDFSKLKLMSGYFRKSSPSSGFTYNMLDVTAIEYNTEKDICIIRTKQSVQNFFTCAPTSEQRSLKPNDVIQMIGYPLGQPMKFSEGKIAETDGDLDDLKGWISFFPGNSGSPIVNFKTGNVVGILVSGSSEITDWAKKNDCYGYRTYENDEDLTAGIIYAENFLELAT